MVVILISVRVIVMQALSEGLVGMCLNAKRFCDAEDLEQVRKLRLLAARYEKVSQGGAGVSQDGRPAGMGADPELCVRAGRVDGSTRGVGMHTGDDAVSIARDNAPGVVLHGRDERHQLAGEGEGGGGGGTRGGRGRGESSGRHDEGEGGGGGRWCRGEEGGGQSRMCLCKGC